ncbi:type II and III secretion system protein family protein [Roseomonas sp. CCTCC AB2023176]|uniref:type II and III secretion system protein family protein n=1 Tax=Roseomonas sp. CCTCC AB2023176 TaxID=3342640 RepID=UPI0035D8BC57
MNARLGQALALASAVLPLGAALAQPALPPVPAGPRAPFPELQRVAVPASAPQVAVIPAPVALEAGTGRLVNLPRPALTVLAADPRVARVQPASPTSLFLMAVAAGRTTVVATAEDGTPVAQYDVTVSPSALAAAASNAGAASPATPPAAPPSAAAVESMIRRMVRGAEGVTVAAAGRNGFVLSGNVPSAADAQRAEAIARAAAGEGSVINNLGLLSSIQVNLRVRVAEVSRTVSRELGFNWRALASDGSSFVLGLQTAGVSSAATALTQGLSGQTAGGVIAGALRSSRFDINGVIDALASDQLISILAEPNLTAQSGEVASFLAGGEFPVPVAANNSSNSITIEFKQFGVSLAFVPTVMGPERLNLRVRPEVSELSDNGSISVPLGSGVVRIPALRVRRAETSVELGSGQSFAIAGLLQRNTQGTNNGVNGLADLPVLGALFRSDRFRRDETELVIIITPYLVRPADNPRELAAPTDGLRPASDLDRILNRRQVARGVAAQPIRARLDAGFILD